MLTKIHIFIPIEKQAMRNFENRFPFVDCTFQMRSMERNISINFDFNALSFLSVIVGERRMHIFVIVRQRSSAGLDEFIVRHWLNYSWVHGRQWTRELIEFTDTLVCCLVLKCEVMAEFLACRLWPV